MTHPTPALFLFGSHHWEDVYGPDERRRLEALLGEPLRFHDAASVAAPAGAADLARAEVIFSGWGMPRCDAAFLAAAPHLKAIFYAAGSIRPFATEALWRRGIVVSSSNAALSVSVAEFALAEILLSLKSAWRHAAAVKEARRHVRLPCAGIYGSVVGLVSVGAVARNLIALLKPFRLRLIAHDPFLSEADARKLGVELRPLDALFAEADVVSLHTPWLPETERMVRGRHLASMKPGATFINTARGAVVDEAELAEVLGQRPDLTALLDVTWPEPPPPESPLYALPNVVLTPHIAGALGTECRRLGAMAADEFERYRDGKPLQGEVREEMMGMIA